MEGRVSPRLSTAKDIAKISHRAGIGVAKYGAVIGGGVSAIRNVVAVFRGDKCAIEALKDVAVDTGKGAQSVTE